MSVRSQPSMLESFTGCHTSFRPRNQLADKVLSLCGDFVPLLPVVVEGAPSHHLQDLLVVITVEGRVPTEQNVEHAACGPHIAADIVVARKHLR